jgi:hypothetical protein
MSFCATIYSADSSRIAHQTERSTVDSDEHPSRPHGRNCIEKTNVTFDFSNLSHIGLFANESRRAKNTRCVSECFI